MEEDELAPPRLYRLPNEQLVALLAESRAEGLGFEAAWQRAVRPGMATVLTNWPDPPEGAVRWPTDSSSRIEWQVAIFDLKDQFRRAYIRRPATRREIAVPLLIELILNVSDRRGQSRGIAAGGAVRSAA